MGGGRTDEAMPMLEFGRGGGEEMTSRPRPSIGMQMPMSEEERSHLEQQQDLEMRMKVRVINDLLKGKIKESDLNKGPQYRGENAWPGSEFNPMAEVLQRLLGGV